MGANNDGPSPEDVNSMPRPKRIQEPGLLRHVMARGNGRMRIFLDDLDYKRFVYLLGEVVEEFDFECWNYCVMPNHYHLTLRPTQRNFSEGIRRLNSVYAMWWNRRHNRVGHVFQGRFKDQIVQCEGYLLTLCRYVARNPVRAGLVAAPQDWKWSSYAAAIGRLPAPPFLSVSAVLSQFGEGDDRTLQERFSRYVLGRLEDGEMDDRFRSNERVLGDKEFKNAIRFGMRTPVNGRGILEHSGVA